MCTAISFLTKDHYFGRNLDLDYSYCEAVTISPKSFPFIFRDTSILKSHFAMIGMATIAEGYPLYYDATNEYGLSMAGLNFPGNAIYLPVKEGCNNVAPFEFIPWILGQCKSVAEARAKLSHINLTNISFSKEFPLTPLHWIISDKGESIVVEPGELGIRIFENPVGVLTNNPPFDFHMHNLANYLNLTRNEPENRFAEQLQLTPYSHGIGAIGLPGDLSSASRFIKAAFTKCNSVCEETETASVSQFFHILQSVEQQRGCVKIKESYEKTVYSSCCNTDRGIYYYTTYENNQITAVQLFHENLQSDKLSCFPLVTGQQIRFEN